MKIRQAVILAGGRGERMRPFTDSQPKPMVQINGKPFLEYLIELLKKNGIEEVVILVGYKHEKITEYFGDGLKFGISIKYSIGAVEDETGSRIRNARELLNDEFLLLYCDNYWPLRLERLYQFHKEHGTLGTVTVYANKHKITRNNMSVNDNGLVVTYDKSRISPNLNGVDVGFFILGKRVLDYMPESNFSFETEIIPKLIERRELSGYLTNERYYSIGSPDRLPMTSEYLSDRRVIFLDRDGTINKRPKKADYVKKWSEFKFLPDSLKALKYLREQKYEVYIISNQPGIARGVMSKDDLDDINEKFVDEVEKAGGHINGIYQCLHNWDEGCECRKPMGGMFYDAAFEHNLNLSKASFIGDDERDGIAGRAVGIKTLVIEPDGDLFAAIRTLHGTL